MAAHLTGWMIRLAIVLLQGVAWLDRVLQPNRAFPRDLPQLLARRAWLEAVLRRGGLLAEGEQLVAVSGRQIKQQEAFRSTVAAVDCEARTADGLSRNISIFAKLSPVATSLMEHAVYILQENAAKETTVYQTLARAPGFPAARAYHVDVHRPSGGFCLLLERLEAREVPEHEGCPPELAEVAIDAFAALHARHWGDETTAARDLRRTPPAVVDWLSRQLQGPDAALFGAMLRRAWAADASAPVAIQHADARVGNLLFVADHSPSAHPCGRRAVFIDWQAARRGKAVFDVAYFLVLSLEPEVRRRHGLALLERYHRALQANGIADYPLATLLSDARMAVLLVLGFVTLPLMSAEASTTQANQAGIGALGTAWARRMVAVVEELDLEEAGARCGIDGVALGAAFRRSNDGAVRDFPVAAVDRAAAQAFVATHGAGLFRTWSHRTGV